MVDFYCHINNNLITLAHNCMKPDNFFEKVIAVIVILLSIEMVVNFVMSIEAKTEYTQNQPK